MLAQDYHNFFAAHAMESNNVPLAYFRLRNAKLPRKVN